MIWIVPQPLPSSLYRCCCMSFSAFCLISPWYKFSVGNFWNFVCLSSYNWQKPLGNPMRSKIGFPFLKIITFIYLKWLHLIQRRKQKKLIVKPHTKKKICCILELWKFKSLNHWEGKGETTCTLLTKPVKIICLEIVRIGRIKYIIS